MSIIRNRAELLNAHENRSTRAALLTIAEHAITAVLPANCVKKILSIDGNLLCTPDRNFELKKFRRIYVIGAGKAAKEMTAEVFKIFGARITAGFVNVPKSCEAKKIGPIILNPAAHPLPDAQGMWGAKKILELCHDAEKNDLIICVLSGGASAMLPVPVPPVTLNDKIKLTKMLMRSGATIEEINTVRKQLSQIKGGKLAVAARPATLLGLIISDIAGDPLEFIGSGPTTPTKTTNSDAVNVLHRYKLWTKVPGSVRKVLMRNESETSEEFEHVHNIVIGNSAIALQAAADKCKTLGYTPVIVTEYMRGDADCVGKKLLALGNTIASRHPQPFILIAGGETVVRLRGYGKGGRCQQLVLSTIHKFLAASDDCARWTLVAIGTDGIDGPTDAAGALADINIIRWARCRKKIVDDAMKRNDSYRFFDCAHGLIKTGATGTNVGDIILLSYGHGVHQKSL